MKTIQNYDAEFCGRVPLHQTNLVQPHGVLLIVKKDDLMVLQASENAAEIFLLPVGELVNQPLPELITAPGADLLRGFLQPQAAGKFSFLLFVQQTPYRTLVEQQERYLLLEIDRTPFAVEDDNSFVSIYQEVRKATTVISACTTTTEACQVAARELKRLSGFDKVMVYQFDAGWNGDVLAEEMEPGMESYYGLKFPASDIPRQARELYRHSVYRLIPTVEYEPVRLYPVLNPLTNAFTDLSASNLRSVAAVHLEYLRNMQVRASMSTRILKDGELWGLIACHHRTPKYLSYEMCLVFELLSNAVTARISAVQDQEQFHYRTAKQDLLRRLLLQMLSGATLASEIEQVLQLLDADGIAVVQNHAIKKAGSTPEEHEIEDLLFWLQANEITGVYHQTALPQVYEPALAFAEIASGLLALAVAPEKGSFVLAFRKEAIQKIDWGGNPGEAIRFENNGRQYHPRASFSSWQQIVRQTALPWPPEALQAAEELQALLTANSSAQNYLA